MLAFFEGKKSHLLALAALIIAGVGYWRGDMTAVDALELVAIGHGISSLRRGLATETEKTVAAVAPGATVPSAAEAKQIVTPPK
jgi:hypothetical protein